jgi:thiamine transport system permease protein
MGSYRSTDADGLALLLGVICLVLALIGAPRTPGNPNEREMSDAR